MWNVIAIALLAAHLLAMNLASGGPLVWAWLVGRGPDERRGELAQRAARQSLAGLLVGIALGAALLAAPAPGLSAALRRFPASAYWFAAAELAFSAAWIVGITVAGRRCQGRPWAAWLAAIITSSNLLYHFPPWMAVIGQLAAEPRWTADEVIPRAALVRLFGRPEILALWTHFALASVAAASTAALWPMRREEATGAGDGVWRRLAIAALVATILQLPVGIWVTATSSPAIRNALMGNDALASAAFLAGVLAALWLMHALATIALGESAPALRRRAGLALIVVVVLMTATLATGRRATDPRSRTSSAAPTRLATATRPALPALR